MNTVETKKPPWIFWGKVLMLTVAVVGHEAVYTAEVSYAIPTLLRTGLKEKYASIVWLFSPLLGILFQGYLGSASDRCLCPWGRRRPFILGLAICVAVSSILFPLGGILSEILGQSGLFVYTLITFGLLDFCLDQFDPPVRMYLLDSVPLQHSDRANYMYTAMTCVGALCGALSGTVRWSRDFKYQVCTVFCLNTCLFVLCTAMALCSFKEENPREKKRKLKTSECDDILTSMDIPDNVSKITKIQEPSPGGSCMCGYCNTPSASILTRTSLLFVSLFQSLVFNIVDSVKGTMEFVMCMSRATLVLWSMVFLDWTVYLCFTIYFSDYIGVVVYGGSPNSREDPSRVLLYDQGVQSSCWCRVAMEIISFCYLLLLDWMTDRVNKKWILATSHVINLVAIVLLLIVPNLYLAVLMSVSCAILGCNMLSIPFTLIHHYEV